MNPRSTLVPGTLLAFCALFHDHADALAPLSAPAQRTPFGHGSRPSAFLSYPEALQLLGVLEGTRRPRPPHAPTPVPDEIDGLLAISYPRSLALLDATLDSAAEVARLLAELRALAIRLSSSSLTSVARAGLARIYRRTVAELDQLVSRARFEGIPLLAGQQELFLFLPPPGAETLRVALPDLTVATLGVSNPASTLTSAHAALDLLDTAIDQVSFARAELAVRRQELVAGPSPGGLLEFERQLVRMRELAVQASAGFLSTSDRAPLDLFFQSHAENLVRALETTRFEGWDLLVGGRVCLQGAPPGTALVFLELPDIHQRVFWLANNEDLQTWSNAAYALPGIDDALAFVARERERIESTRTVLERGFLPLR